MAGIPDRMEHKLKTNASHKEEIPLTSTGVDHEETKTVSNVNPLAGTNVIPALTISHLNLNKSDSKTTSSNSQQQRNIISCTFKCKCESDRVWVPLINLLLCSFMCFICILYGFGQITQLELSYYWCNKKELETIYKHSSQYSLNEGTNDGCWKSKLFTVK